MSPQDIELAKIFIAAGGKAIELGIEWFMTGQRPPPERIEAVWADVEQLKAKLATDAAADARWPEG